jgi:hypothetical protein
VSSYTAVFGQLYYPVLKCPLEMIHQCETISQHLHISRDEKLEKYVIDNDIVDLEEGSTDEFVDEEDSEDDSVDDRKHPFEMDFNPVKMARGSYDMDTMLAELEDIDIRDERKQPPPLEGFIMNPSQIGDSLGTMLVNFSATTNSSSSAQCMGELTVVEPCSLWSMSKADRNMMMVLEANNNDEQGQDSFASPPSPTVLFDTSPTSSPGIQKHPLPGPDPTMMGSLWPPRFDPVPSPPHNQGQTTYCSSKRFEGTVQNAWEHGLIARYDHPLSKTRMHQYWFVYATLNCNQFCFPAGPRSMVMGNSDYLGVCRNTTRWYDGNFISTFGALATHYTHLTAHQHFVLCQSLTFPSF